MDHELRPATLGVGPLLQRDYWAVISGCPLKPSEVMAHVTSHFCELPPPALVAVVADHGVGVNAELEIRIMPAQSCRVRVVHQDAQSLTLGTLEGHPEAGRITFGSYRNTDGGVILHIRSRARSSSTATRLGFLAIGDAMQTNTWTDFINRAAVSMGAHILDVIHTDTAEVDELAEDGGPLRSATFAAVGD